MFPSWPAGNADMGPEGSGSGDVTDIGDRGTLTVATSPTNTNSPLVMRWIIRYA